MGRSSEVRHPRSDRQKHKAFGDKCVKMSTLPPRLWHIQTWLHRGIYLTKGDLNNPLPVHEIVATQIRNRRDISPLLGIRIIWQVVQELKMGSSWRSVLFGRHWKTVWLSQLLILGRTCWDAHFAFEKEGQKINFLYSWNFWNLFSWYHHPPCPNHPWCHRWL